MSPSPSNTGIAGEGTGTAAPRAGRPSSSGTGIAGEGTGTARVRAEPVPIRRADPVPAKNANHLRLIGTPFRRVDARAKVTGQTRFADDLTFPRMVHMKLARSTVPHAKIKNIDTTKAQKMPGVLHILTGDSMPEPFGILPVSQDEHALCRDKVRFVGDPVVALTENHAYESCLGEEEHHDDGRAARCTSQGWCGGGLVHDRWPGMIRLRLSSRSGSAQPKSHRLDSATCLHDWRKCVAHSGGVQ